MAVDRPVWQWKRETDHWITVTGFFCFIRLFEMPFLAVLFLRCRSPFYHFAAIPRVGFRRPTKWLNLHRFSTGTIPASSAWAWPGVLAKLPSTSSMQRRRKWAISCSILRRWCGPFSIPTYFSSLAMTSSMWSLVQCIREPEPLRCAGIPMRDDGNLPSETIASTTIVIGICTIYCRYRQEMLYLYIR